MCDYRQGLDWRLDLLTTLTNDLIGAIANLHTLQITRAHRLVFSACHSLH
jgi:hypothetical protein